MHFFYFRIIVLFSHSQLYRCSFYDANKAHKNEELSLLLFVYNFEYYSCQRAEVARGVGRLGRKERGGRRARASWAGSRPSHERGEEIPFSFLFLILSFFFSTFVTFCFFSS
jgi:hypothetical protein